MWNWKHILYFSWFRWISHWRGLEEGQTHISMDTYHSKSVFFFFSPRGEKGIFTEAMQLHSIYRCGWLFFPLCLTRVHINQKENGYRAYLFHCFCVYESVISVNTLWKISPICLAIWMMFLFRGILLWKVKLCVLCGVVYNNAVNASPQASWTIPADQHRHKKLILNIPEVTFTDELVAWYVIAFFTWEKNPLLSGPTAYVDEVISAGGAHHPDWIVMNFLISENVWKRAAGFAQCHKLMHWTRQWQEARLGDDVVKMDR